MVAFDVALIRETNNVSSNCAPFIYTVQIFVKGAKGADAGPNDIEIGEPTWGVGSKITTKLVNVAGEVSLR